MLLDSPNSDEEKKTKEKSMEYWFALLTFVA